MERGLGATLGLFASAVVWHGLFRFGLFWGIVVVALVAIAPVAPFSDWSIIREVLGEVASGDIRRVSNKDFAFALASGIGQFALSLSLGFFVAHVLLIRAAMLTARLSLGRRDPIEFAANFDSITDRLRHHGLIGHAWSEFDKTLHRDDNAVHAVVRPQIFINLADVRERLFGLKMMPSIPGFFVGLGLLFTFIGLLFALYSAAQSTSAGSAEEMKESLAGLLAAATFKFSTSIAGLGASLLLSLLFRVYQIWIDRSLYLFGIAVEARVLSYSPQQIATEARDILAAQRDELKEINSAHFFSRLGQSVAPSIEAAVSAAVQPMTRSLDTAVGQLRQRSETGINEMLQQFLTALRGGAGLELAQVGRSLDAVRVALEGVQRNLSGSGTDFSLKLTEAADNMTRLIVEAGHSLRSSATGAAGSMEAAMGEVVQKLDGQISSFVGTMTQLQATLSAQAEESAKASRLAGDTAAEASRQMLQDTVGASKTIAREAMESIHTGMNEVVASLRRDIESLSTVLRTVSTSFATQTQQIDAAAARSHDVADAFGRVANDVRSASAPLVTHSERMVHSTEQMAQSIAASIDTLATSQRIADEVADRLSAHLEQIGRVWNEYEARFKGVDEDLSRAAERFHEEVTRHQDAMRSFVSEVDQHTAKILDALTSGLNSLGQNIDELTKVLEDLPMRLPQPEPAE